MALLPLLLEGHHGLCQDLESEERAAAGSARVDNLPSVLASQVVFPSLNRR